MSTKTLGWLVGARDGKKLGSGYYRMLIISWYFKLRNIFFDKLRVDGNIKYLPKILQFGKKGKQF